MNLYPEDLPSRSMVFLGGGDELLHGPEVGGGDQQAIRDAVSN